MSPSKFTIADLHPELPPEQSRDAEEGLRRYLSLVLRIYKQLTTDPERYATFRSLTAPEEPRTIDGKGRTITSHGNETDV